MRLTKFWIALFLIASCSPVLIKKGGSGHGGKPAKPGKPSDDGPGCHNINCGSLTIDSNLPVIIATVAALLLG